MDTITATGPDTISAGFNLVGFLMDYGPLVGFILTYYLQLLASSGNKAIATVNEVRKGENMSAETAKSMAVALLKKYMPFIPDIIAASFIQFLFDRMKKQAVIVAPVK